VYLGACTDVPNASVAAHELLHALSALPDGAPHPCSLEDDGHPCDSQQDILYPFASGALPQGLVLDVGRDGRTVVVLPFSEDVIVDVDRDERRVVVEVPEGLMD